MTAYARVLIFFAVAALVVAPRTSRAGESEDADRALFIKYCAACHGVDGKGGGVAAPALAKAPPDLRRLARDAGGEFPLGRVIRAIDGRDTVRPTAAPTCRCGEKCSRPSRSTTGSTSASRGAAWPSISAGFRSPAADARSGVQRT